jgi:hypothetical protein
MRQRRELTPFSLSFLDIMSCGFGAVVLLFLIIKHNVSNMPPLPAADRNTASEVSMLEKEIKEGKAGLAELRNTIAEVEEKKVTAEGLARKIQEKLEDKAGEVKAESAMSQTAEIEKLKQDLKKMQEEKNRMEAKTGETGRNIRSFTGEGNRQYLSGLKLGGSRILVLMDVSASMLDDTIVNVIRRRNMSNEVKRSSHKWQQSLRIADWLTTQFPPGSRFQIYAFNTSAKSVIKDSTGQWLSVSKPGQLDQAIQKLRQFIPAGGTSLENAFIAAAGLSPLPDNIYLITDGLPTQGRRPPAASTVSGRQRMEYFAEALKKLPVHVPVNTILVPMEGDPLAASAFWQLGQLTQGSFLSPTEDWP